MDAKTVESIDLMHFTVELKEMDLEPDHQDSAADSALRLANMMVDNDLDHGWCYSDHYCDLAASREFRELVTKLAEGTLPLTYFAALCYMAGRLSTAMYGH